MNRNRFAIAAIVATLIVGVVSLTWTTKRPPVQIASAMHDALNTIGGNASLVPAPEQYTVVCFPQNWQTDAASQKLIAEMKKPAFNRVLHSTTPRIYVDGDPDFEHRFQSDANTGPISTAHLPTVVAIDHGRNVGCWSGQNCGKIALEIENCFPKLNPLKPKEPEVKPEPAPVDRPKVPDIVDTHEPAKTEEPNTPLAIGIVGVVCAAVWGIMFRNRPA